MKQNQDTTVTVKQIVQILWVVSCVNVGKATVEMVSLAGVRTCGKSLGVDVLCSIKQFI